MNRTTTLTAISAIVACIFFTGVVHADDVVVSASVDPTVARVGNEVLLTVTIQGKFRRTAEYGEHAMKLWPSFF